MGSGLQAMHQRSQDDLDERLLDAAYLGSDQQVALLILDGANVNARGDRGHTPIIIAAIQGHYEICEMLVGSKADVNAKDADGVTALMYAAEWGRNEICRLLIARGADVHEIDNDGWTALWWAASEKRKIACKLLIDAMIKPTKEQVDATVALLGISKNRRSEQLNLVGRDVVKLIGQQVFNENKAKTRAQIMKIKDVGLRNELLDYLNRSKQLKKGE